MLSIIPLPYRLIFMAVAAIALVGFGWVKGNEHGTAKLTEYIGAQAKEGARIVTKQGQETEKIITQYIKVKGATQIVTQTVEKEVVKYAESNPGFCLDARWRLLHDAAATNTIPDASRLTDGTLSAPRAAEALDTVVTNYAACNAAEDKLDALQDWVRQQVSVR